MSGGDCVLNMLACRLAQETKRMFTIMTQEDPTLTAGRFTLHLTRTDLALSLKNLDGVGPKSAQILRDRGIMDQLDLLLTTPKRYQRIAHHVPGPQVVQRQLQHLEFYAPITHVRKPSPGTKQPLEVSVDHNGQIFRLLWFNMPPSFSKRMGVDRWLHIVGSPSYNKSVPELMHPTISIMEDNPAIPAAYFSVKPVYTAIEGFGEKKFRKALYQSLENVLPYLGDIVPISILQQNDLPSIAEALSVIHVLRQYHDVARFQQALKRARNRVVYEEFFTLQLKLATDYHTQRKRANAPQCTQRQLGRQLISQLPFKLTGDQNKACATIATELGDVMPMRRLLQGDVGSGKTVVALIAAAIAVDNGQQVAMMAPTDILARQHLRRAQSFFGEMPINLTYLGGSLGAAERRETLASMANGEANIVFGTHALFQDDVAFDHLGLVIIDEQHKFGVEQRQRLLDKGPDPHLLAMTATPIPRSLAHAVFGDLDLTVIREKPPGRQPIRTVLRNRASAPKAYDYIRQRIKDSGEQAYFVYPMVEASHAVPGRENVTDAAQKLAEGPFEGLNVGVLHGRMHNDEKDVVMSQFADGELDVLCATTVVEVGVDVSNATLMVIESPEVFGLSQLHQLRGRVGRGDQSSMCILLAGFDLSSEAQHRLRSFSETDDGFELAEIDLKIRGPGLFLGLRQAGQAEFRFGDLFRDADLLTQARTDARQHILGQDAPV